MAIDITFDSVPNGFFQSYAEQGFTFTTLQGVNLGISDVLWSGLSKVNEGTGNYLINEYSQDSIVVKYTGGANTFGATGLDVDGYKNGSFDSQGNIIPATAQVTFNFTGVKADYTQVHYSFTTDNVTGWEHITLPSEFASGLTSLTWTTNASSEAWGAFDNVELSIDSTTAPPPADPPSGDPTGTNHAPVAVADNPTVTVHTTTMINVTANDTDADGDNIGIAKFGPDAAHLQSGIASKSALGADISFQDGQIVYNADAASYANLGIGQSATDSFYYTATDADGATSTAKVTVTIVNPDHAPTVVADTAAVNNDQSVTIDVLHNDSDVDAGDSLTLSGFGASASAANAYHTTGTSALGSSVSITNGKLVYNANAAVLDSLAPGQSQVDTVYYTVTDSHGLSSVSSVSVTVTAPAAVNHAPTANADTASVTDNQSVTIDVLANDRDADGDSMSLAGFGKTASAANTYHTTGTSALGADVSIVNGKLVYNADAAAFDKLSSSQSQTDTVYYTVTDSHGASSVASVTITVKGGSSSDGGGGGGCDDGHHDNGNGNGGNDSGHGNGNNGCGDGPGNSGNGNGNGNDGSTSNSSGKTITGTSHADTLTGASKAETIHGADGNDKINGGDGADHLYGDGGNDSVCGGDGSDTLEGGAGNDTLTGGDDNDTFVFGANFGKDVITDFHGGHAGSSGADCSSVFNIFSIFGIFFGGGGGSGSSSSSGQWQAGDVVSIASSEFHNYNDLLSHAKQTSQGVLITTSDGHDSLLIQGLSLNNMDSHDFIFT